MKIWKSDLQGLVEEVQGAIYLVAASETRTGKDGTAWATFYVAAAGFNPDGRVCELRINQPVIMAVVREDNIATHKRNLQVLEEVRMRLEGLGRLVRDGAISDTPIGGAL